MKRNPSFAIPQLSRQAVLTALVIIAGLFVVCKFAFGSKSGASKRTPAEASEGTHRTLPDGPRLAVLKGSYGFSDRDAAAEYSKEYERILNLDGKGFDKASNELNARFQKGKRRFAFSRDCVVRLSKNPPIGKLHEGFVEDAEDDESSAIWIEEKYLMDTTSVSGSRLLTGFYVLSGSEGVELDGVFVSTLEDLLAALAEGQMSAAKAESCVFMPETQGIARVQSVLKEHVICTGAGTFQFAMRKDGKEDPLSGMPVRYVGHEEFATKNGTVRELPVFRAVPNIKRERVFDDSQFEAIKTN